MEGPEGVEAVRNENRTLCIHGHPLSGDNLWVEHKPNGLTVHRCKTCRRETGKRRRTKYQGTERKLVTRDELVELISLGKSWLELAIHFGVSDVAIRKRAVRWGLFIPSTRSNAAVSASEPTPA
jgi:hypothetical protein